MKKGQKTRFVRVGGTRSQPSLMEIPVGRGHVEEDEENEESLTGSEIDQQPNAQSSSESVPPLARMETKLVQVGMATAAPSLMEMPFREEKPVDDGRRSAAQGEVLRIPEDIGKYKLKPKRKREKGRFVRVGGTPSAPSLREIGPSEPEEEKTRAPDDEEDNEWMMRAMKLEPRSESQRWDMKAIKLKPRSSSTPARRHGARRCVCVKIKDNSIPSPRSTPGQKKNSECCRCNRTNHRHHVCGCCDRGQKKPAQCKCPCSMRLDDGQDQKNFSITVSITL